MTRYTAFCRILELGSFTRAAESLGYTQAAISQMVRSLENEFSMKLLIRTRTGVRLTPEGEKLAPLLQKLVLDKRELDDRVREINGLEAGEIRIGTFSSMSQHVLTRLMRDFSERYPKARFSLQMGDNATLPQWLHDGLIDFAFVYPEVTAGMPHLTLLRDAFMAVVPYGHRLASYDVIPLSEFEAESLILVEEGRVSTVLDAFSAQGVHPTVKYRIHDDYTIQSMVEQGLGVSLLAATIVDHSVYHFRRIPTDPPIKRSISVAYTNADMLPVATKQFLRFMLEKLPDYIQDDYTEITYDPATVLEKSF